MHDLEFGYFVKGAPDEDGNSKVFAVTESEAFKKNEQGFDLFWTPQMFNGFGQRSIATLSELRFLCADFDNITKQQLQENLSWVPEPSFVVGTRSGFHVYWRLRQFIKASFGVHDMYREFIDSRIVPLGCDPQAKDVSRMLRPPMTKYWWDSKGNYHGDKNIFTTVEFEGKEAYTWEELEEFFPVVERPHHKEHKLDVTPKAQGIKREPDTRSNHGIARETNFWTRANQLPALEALERLSGTAHVGSEVFSFKKQSGLTRIYCNGKPSNAWIDKNGLIGSTVNAGPSVVNWLSYYGHSQRRIAEILKEVFPELEK